MLRMAQLYPDDFDELGIEALSCELNTFIINVHDEERFFDLRGIGELSRKLLQTKKHMNFLHLYLLVKLALLYQFPLQLLKGYSQQSRSSRPVCATEYQMSF